MTTLHGVDVSFMYGLNHQLRRGSSRMAKLNMRKETDWLACSSLSMSLELADGTR